MHTLNCKGKILSLDKPVVMGIVNLTPDSFYSGQLTMPPVALLQLVQDMLAAGASIIDLGGQSTRPGSQRLSAAEEMDRVIPALRMLKENFEDSIFSIDTFYSEVAAAAVSAGASMVNDISFGGMDSNMLATVASLQVPYIGMHMQGTPATMQQQPQYHDVTLEVLDYFIEKVEQCSKAGIGDVVLDPGFGFGKLLEHNYTLLKNLEAFKMLHRPLLVGLSRKSMIYKLLNLTANEALNGSTVLHTLALQNGAHILRVHDVKEAMEVVNLLQFYKAQ